MRIYYLSGSVVPSRSANAVHVMKMAQALAAAGHDVTLFARRSPESSGDCSDWAYFGVRENFGIVKSSWPSIPGVGGVLYAKSVLKHLKSGSVPDLLYGRHATSLLMARDLGCPIRFEAHAPPPDSLRARVLGRLLFSATFDKLIVISNALRKEFLRLYPKLNPEKVIVAHDGADDVGVSTGSSPIRIEKCQGAVADIGYVGHLYPGKGMELIDLISGRMQEVTFHVIGGTERDVQFWREKAKNRENLRIYGHVPHSGVPRLLEQFDIVLAPYQHQVRVHGGKGDVASWMSPLKLFEYMASGKAMIVSDLPVLREVIRDGENGVLCPPDDVEAWVTSIRRLVANPEKIRQLGSRALREFLEKYTWSQRARTVLC